MELVKTYQMPGHSVILLYGHLIILRLCVATVTAPAASFYAGYKSGAPSYSWIPPEFCVSLNQFSKYIIYMYIKIAQRETESRRIFSVFILWIIMLPLSRIIIVFINTYIDKYRISIMIRRRKNATLLCILISPHSSCFSSTTLKHEIPLAMQF